VAFHVRQVDLDEALLEMYRLEHRRKTRDVDRVVGEEHRLVEARFELAWVRLFRVVVGEAFHHVPLPFVAVAVVALLQTQGCIRYTYPVGEDRTYRGMVVDLDLACRVGDHAIVDHVAWEVERGMVEEAFHDRREEP
jgi:hypothetical protein